MTATAKPLAHVLSRHETGRLDLDALRSNELKRAASFWCGTAAYKLRKEECIRALQEVGRDRARAEAVLQSLPDKKRQVLAIFERYGGALSGMLLLTELRARGLVAKPEFKQGFYVPTFRDKLVEDLQSKLLLVPTSDARIADSYSYSSYRRNYPDLALLPSVRGAIPPVSVLPWKPSGPASTPDGNFARSCTVVALDLAALTHDLGQLGSWKITHGGAPARSAQNKLKKRAAAVTHDPLLPPDPEGLYYEILRSLGAFTFEDKDARVDPAFAALQLQEPPEVQAWNWVRAWLRFALWEDGIGMVRDSDAASGYSSNERRAVREMLVWALCQVAHAAEQWLDLETFLVDLWSINTNENPHAYWHQFAWKPDFKQARDAVNPPVGPARSLASWLANAGTWAANVLVGTFAYLGLVERGQAQKGSFGFRLTPLGRAVFGAPEQAFVDTAHESHFLTVQPNHEIVAYLDAADTRAVWPLGQMARRVSGPGERIQTFALTRESVYQALESGLSLDEMQQFLIEHSRTGLPANVAQSLAEWGRRREALVLRTGVVLAVHPPGQDNSLPAGERLGDRAMLLSAKALRNLKSVPRRDHRTRSRPVLSVAEDGRVSGIAEADALTLARLSQFAEQDAAGWIITADSVRRARDRNMPVGLVMYWLTEEHTGEVPALVETAIHNWYRPASVFLGEVVLLQVPQPEAAAMIRESPRFQPLLLGHVPPNWFLVRPERRETLERLLEELGFVPAAHVLGGIDTGEMIEAGSQQRSRKRSRP
jgi:hypothetical protein